MASRGSFESQEESTLVLFRVILYSKTFTLRQSIPLLVKWTINRKSIRYYSFYLLLNQEELLKAQNAVLIEKIKSIENKTCTVNERRGCAPTRRTSCLEYFPSEVLEVSYVRRFPSLIWRNKKIWEGKRRSLMHVRCELRVFSNEIRARGGECLRGRFCSRRRRTVLI